MIVLFAKVMFRVARLAPLSAMTPVLPPGPAIWLSWMRDVLQQARVALRTVLLGSGDAVAVPADGVVGDLGVVGRGQGDAAALQPGARAGGAVLAGPAGGVPAVVVHGVVGDRRARADLDEDALVPVVVDLRCW